MAPEQASGRQADHRGDIYSLGIVAYEMLVGTVPFSADSPVAVLLKHVNEPLPVPPDGLMAPAMMRAIQKAAAKHPEDRWSSAGAFVTALEAAVAAEDALPIRGANRAERRTERSRMVFAGAAGALVGVAGLAWFAMREPASDPAPTPPIATDARFDVVQRAAPAPIAQEVDVSPVAAVTAPALRGPRVDAAAPPPTPEAQAPPNESVLQPVRRSANIDPAPESSDQAPTTAPEVPAATDPATNAVVVPTAPAADVITAPTRIRTIEADYPIVARAAELEGEVLLQAVVQADGKVSNVEVLRSVHAVLDEAARKAVMQYEYTPGRRNGIPETSTVRITVSFRLR
jgi:serine/threonine-protein kinase